MPPDEGRARNCCIWFISCFFFLTLIVGGAFLVLYMILPESPDTLWFPIAGIVLVAIPWLFWITTCIYRSITASKYDIERPPMRAAAVAPAAATSANTATDAAATATSTHPPMNNPPADHAAATGTPVAAGGDDGTAPERGADGGSNEDLSLKSHDSEVPSAFSMS